MALISLRQLLDHAAEHDYGVPAFNVNNLEQTRAIMEAADQTNSPVIMQGMSTHSRGYCIGRRAAFATSCGVCSSTGHSCGGAKCGCCKIGACVVGGTIAS